MLDSIPAPRVVHRACGGWLVYSAPGASLKIGVTAESEEAAKADYEDALEQWRTLLETS
jgi:hypothetical protein